MLCLSFANDQMSEGSAFRGKRRTSRGFGMRLDLGRRGSQFSGRVNLLHLPSFRIEATAPNRVRLCPEGSDKGCGIKYKGGARLVSAESQSSRIPDKVAQCSILIRGKTRLTSTASCIHLLLDCLRSNCV